MKENVFRKFFSTIGICLGSVVLVSGCSDYPSDSTTSLVIEDSNVNATTDSPDTFLKFAKSSDADFAQSEAEWRSIHEGYLRDDDPSGDEFIRYMLSFNSAADYMAFQSDATYSQMENYALSQGISNPFEDPVGTFPTEESTNTNDTLGRASLRFGEGAPHECVYKFKWEYRNNNRPHYMYRFGIWRLPVQYYINANGQPSIAIREPSFFNVSGGRDTTCQSDVGSTGYFNADEGGHLIANSLGGWGKRINLTAQDKVLNRRVFTSIEDAVKKCITDYDMATQYTVKPKYDSSHTMRPVGYDVSVNILHRSADTARLFGYLSNTTYSEAKIRELQAESNIIREFCRTH